MRALIDPLDAGALIALTSNCRACQQAFKIQISVVSILWSMRSDVTSGYMLCKANDMLSTRSTYNALCNGCRKAAMRMDCILAMAKALSYAVFDQAVTDAICQGSILHQLKQAQSSDRQKVLHLAYARRPWQALQAS